MASLSEFTLVLSFFPLPQGRRSKHGTLAFSVSSLLLPTRSFLVWERPPPRIRVTAPGCLWRNSFRPVSFSLFLLFCSLLGAGAAACSWIGLQLRATDSALLMFFFISIALIVNFLPLVSLLELLLKVSMLARALSLVGYLT